MLAIVTKAPQPSSTEEANERRVSFYILKGMENQFPITVHDNGTASFDRDNLSLIESNFRKMGYYIKPIDTALAKKTYDD